MISFRDVTLIYPDAAEPTLSDINVFIEEGELCLVVGPTGSGKSTFLGCINGLVPHFTGGHLKGTVTVDGHSTADFPPRELADVVGVVGQDPLAGFVTDTVEEELAYAMEQLAVPPDVMRKRVEETLDLLGIADLRSRTLRSLSGGQQQRVAIGSVLTAHPKVLVLDEPTSALDPTAAEEVLAAITRLVHDLGVTVVIAEHRLERVVQYADRVIYIPGDGSVVSGPPADVLARSPISPPVVQLGKLAGWSPLPLSVRDARRMAPELRERLATRGCGPVHDDSISRAGTTVRVGTTIRADTGSVRELPEGDSEPLLSARRLLVTYGGTVAVRDVDLDLYRGRVVAIMGRNGSGKSSLLWALQGSGKRAGGSVGVTCHDGTRRDPAKLSATEARSLVGLVPQTPGDLLYLSSVSEECSQADRESGASDGTCRGLLDRLVPGIDGDAHPRDLSEGQRLALVLAIQLTALPDVILLDEPTRGLDYRAKANLIDVLGELARSGRAVMVATHDVEFVASAADRVVVLAQGEVVADGPTKEVIVSSPAFAPQVAKILSPLQYLTVDQVRADLAGVAP